jgi:hypothetical protein
MAEKDPDTASIFESIAGYFVTSDSEAAGAARPAPAAPAENTSPLRLTAAAARGVFRVTGRLNSTYAIDPQAVSSRSQSVSRDVMVVPARVRPASV